MAPVTTPASGAVSSLSAPWPGPLKQKVFAMEQCEPAKWILLLDSDESLEPELRADMERVIREMIRRLPLGNSSARFGS